MMRFTRRSSATATRSRSAAPPLCPRLLEAVMLILLTATLYGCQTVTATVVISEVSDKGTANHCNRNDWVELYNSGTEDVDIAGWILHDDKGAHDKGAHIFPLLAVDTDHAPRTLLKAGAFVVVCVGGGANSDSPAFSIGSSDEITLIDTTTTSNGTVVSQVKLSGEGSGFGFTYALDETDSTYKYTMEPTPGLPNIITSIPPLTERLAAQNAQGTSFFNMDIDGLPVANGLDAVVDLHITMEEAAFQDLIQNATYQLYSPFTSARVVVKSQRSSSVQNSSVSGQKIQDDIEQVVILNLTSPGRIRAKGQSSLVYGLCLNSMTLPFILDFSNDLPSQTLFGVEKLYLRHHMGDSSCMREWVAHRMLARFGLPHLRTRTVRFYINEQRIGLYTAMEAVEQDYVFYRNFPSANFSNYALYKFKTLSIGCGKWDEDEDKMALAKTQVNANSTPPYSYEAGTHREKIPQTLDCNPVFQNVLEKEFQDIRVAYLRYDQDCGRMLVDQGIVQRELGNKEWDIVMAKFINENLANNTWTHYQNSNLTAEVDVNSFLKNFAVYTVALIIDSPIGNGNNYYLANPGDETGWNIVPYDQNTRDSLLCNPEVCNPRLVHWSIVRPTCQSLEDNQLVGPLLTNATLLAQYIEYVRLFVDQVMGNASLIEQIQEHGKAIQDDTKWDFWSKGSAHLFEDNLKNDPTLWNKNINRIDGRPVLPLLPLYAARVMDVRNQLEAIAQGTFPRGIPNTTPPVERYEFCVDWRSTEPDNSTTSTTTNTAT